MASGIRSRKVTSHTYPGGQYLVSTTIVHLVFDSGREAVVTRYVYEDGHRGISVIGGSLTEKWGPLHRFGGPAQRLGL